MDEKIEYICEVEDGWWKGRSKGRVGVFPSNFVEVRKQINWIQGMELMLMSWYGVWYGVNELVMFCNEK